MQRIENTTGLPNLTQMTEPSFFIQTVQMHTNNKAAQDVLLDFAIHSSNFDYILFSSDVFYLFPYKDQKEKLFQHFMNNAAAYFSLYEIGMIFGNFSDKEKHDELFTFIISNFGEVINNMSKLYELITSPLSKEENLEIFDCLLQPAHFIRLKFSFAWFLKKCSAEQKKSFFRLITQPDIFTKKITDLIDLNQLIENFPEEKETLEKLHKNTGINIKDLAKSKESCKNDEAFINSLPDCIHISDLKPWTNNNSIACQNQLLEIILESGKFNHSLVHIASIFKLETQRTMIFVKLTQPDVFIYCMQSDLSAPNWHSYFTQDEQQNTIISLLSTPEYCYEIIKDIETMSAFFSCDRTEEQAQAIRQCLLVPKIFRKLITPATIEQEFIEPFKDKQRKDFLALLIQPENLNRLVFGRFTLITLGNLFNHDIFKQPTVKLVKIIAKGLTVAERAYTRGATAGMFFQSDPSLAPEIAIKLGSYIDRKTGGAIANTCTTANDFANSERAKFKK